MADDHYQHIKDQHPDSSELRKHQDKIQFRRLVAAQSPSCSFSDDSNSSLAMDHASDESETSSTTGSIRGSPDE